MSHYMWWLLFLAVASGAAAALYYVRRRPRLVQTPRNVTFLLKQEDEAKVRDTAAYADVTLRTKAPTQEQKSQLLTKELKELEQLGTTRFEQGDYNAAKQRFLQVLGIARVANDSVYGIRALHNLGLTYARQGEQAEAVRLLKQSTQLAAVEPGIDEGSRQLFSANLQKVQQQTVGNRAQSLYEAGKQAAASRDFETARRNFAEASKLASASNNNELEAASLNSLAGVCHKTGQFDRGLELLQRAQMVCRKASLPDTHHLLLDIDANVQLLNDEKQSQGCRKLLNEAAKLIADDKQPAAEAKAREAYDSICKTVGGTHWLAAIALDYQAVALMNQGDHWRAKSLLTSASWIASEWPDSADEAIKSIEEHLQRCTDELGR